MMAASMALAGLSGCGPEPNPRQLVPYVEQPPALVPGDPAPLRDCDYHRGYAEGVLVTHQMGRPVKVEGNPDHPASLGAASAIMQARILASTTRGARSRSSAAGRCELADFVAALFERRQTWASGGKRLRLLTGTVTSPTFAAQIAALQQQFPAMRLASSGSRSIATRNVAPKQAFRPRRRSRVRSDSGADGSLASKAI